MSAILLIALGWIVLALLVAGFTWFVVKCPMSFGVWEHEPFSPQSGRAGRPAPADGARGATRPTIINALARTGALECPKPKLETPNSEPMKLTLLILTLAVCLNTSAQSQKPEPPGAPKVTAAASNEIVILITGSAITNTMTAPIQGTAHLITVTNWSDSPFKTTTAMAWTGPVDPNITTHFEAGTICQQVIGEFDWKGEKKTLLLESRVVGTTQRAYTLETRRVYK